MEPDDLVFNPMWAIGGGVAVSQVRGAVSTAYRVYSLTGHLLPRFLHYYVRCDAAIQQYALVIRGTTTFDRSVTRDDFEMMPVPIPPLPQQRAIADYLDRETGRIDALIEKKRDLTERLAERRQALITLAVQGDVGPGAASRGDGVSEIRPLRAYAEVALGRQRSPQHEEGSHMTPYLRAANVKDGILDLTDVKEMNFAPPEQQMFSLKKGDVLVTEGSGSLGSVGASAVWSSEIEGPVCFQNTLLRLRPRPGTDPRFLAWWCRHAFADGIFASVALGANIFHVSADRVRALPLRYVSLSTQRAVADYLDRETARIDALIAKINQQLDLLTEHRQALITAAVTGELDVPEVAA
ncbi:MAG: restriction endonuclease subunit S [Actinomycetota bacterium]|nr:restriction endonuclease subunit S [Actinomycetota bacterium]